VAGGNGDDGGSGPKQLQIWDTASHELTIGEISEGKDLWEVYVVVEVATGDLYRGRISFRDGATHYDTVPILVEESEAAVVKRATELPRSMLLQLLTSLRD
jgi:hypothetical protein